MSKIQLSTYINFQGKAREAMEFYHRVLGGNLELQGTDEQGASGAAGGSRGGNVMYSRLETDGASIVGVDGHPNYPPTVGDNMAIALGGADKERMSRIFNELAEGGKIKMPLSRQPWGGEVGWLADRFGISWMVSVQEG